MITGSKRNSKEEAVWFQLNHSIKHPKHTGAIAPSSKILAKKMVDVIDFNKAKCIVELKRQGFTKEIMKRKRRKRYFFLLKLMKYFSKN